MTISYTKLEIELKIIQKQITTITDVVARLHGRLLKLEKPDNYGALPTIDLKGVK